MARTVLWLYECMHGPNVEIFSKPTRMLSHDIKFQLTFQTVDCTHGNSWRSLPGLFLNFLFAIADPCMWNINQYLLEE